MKESKLLWILLGLLFVLPFGGCLKKGEEDPFFSIYPRKTRVIADWDINTMVSDILRTNDDGTKINTIFEITNGTNASEFTETFEFALDTSYTHDGEVIEAYYEFDKTGKMEHVMHYRLIWSVDSLDGNEWVWNTKTTYTKKIIAKGTWNFLGRVDDYKNKERLALVFETYNIGVSTSILKTVTDDAGEPQPALTTNVTNYGNIENKYGNGESAEIWELNMLKNKEIIMYRIIDRLVNDQWDSTGTKYTEKGYETITLTRETK
ncbi:MAG: hypothetical protein ABIJ97_10120 [Bacteroidota bacterium]